MMGIIMFFVALALLMLGFEVAFTFGTVAIIFAAISPEISFDVFNFLPFRIYGIMSNFTLMAVPLFIFMGLVLEKSRMAEDLLISISKLFGSVRGGLAIGVVLVGMILAASTGIVSASVVMMSVIALPLMLNHGYSKSLSAGTIAASGTLGQIIPPSIVLIILGDVMSVSVGDLFKGAVLPGLLLVGLYLFYILAYSFIKKDVAPAIEGEKESLSHVLNAVLPPLALIFVVLGSIFAGIASPTESAAFGVIGAVILSLYKKTFSVQMVRYATMHTVKLCGMIFMILIGATAFSLVFNELGGADLLVDFFSNDIADPWIFIGSAMLIIFILGFFIDFLEISFIVVPIMVPILAELGIDPLWFAVLVAMNLQASFITPPFGLSLFFLKGSSKDMVTTLQIYKGILPFIFLQILAIAIVVIFPNLVFAFL